MSENDVRMEDTGNKIHYVPKEACDGAVDLLLSGGVTDTGQVCPECVTDIHTHLQTQLVHVGAHVEAKTYGTSVVKPDAGFYCYDLATAVSTPGLFNIALSMLPIAAQYFNEEPVLYSMNIYGVRGGVTRPGVNEFHRDYGDRKQLCMLMYLSDVNRYQHGPFEYVRRSHRDTMTTAVGNGRFNPEHVATQYYDGVAIIDGTPGTMFLFDPHGLHRAAPTTRGDRRVFWARYGVSEAPADYVKDKLKPVSAKLLRNSHHSVNTPKMYDDYAKRCSRLIVEW